MTEAEWLACTDLWPMLGYLRASKENRSRSGRRKLRLFGCGCGRRVLRMMSGRGRRWLAVAERYEVESVDREQRRKIRSEDIGTVDGQRTDHQADMAAWFTLGSNVMIAAGAAARSAAGAIELEAWHQGTDYHAAEAAERMNQVVLLRDIFGNPFRPVALDPAWFTWHDGTIPKIAQSVYDDRDLPSGHLDAHRLAVLADALEDAGCDDPDILAHCRGPGPHVRGCWVIDLLLGKE
jgi:hypothetical protein